MRKENEGRDRTNEAWVRREREKKRNKKEKGCEKSMFITHSHW
jgi:hypothetical protein